MWSSRIQFFKVADQVADIINIIKLIKTFISRMLLPVFQNKLVNNLAIRCLLLMFLF